MKATKNRTQRHDKAEKETRKRVMIQSVMRELRAVKAPAALSVSLRLCDLVRGVAESGLDVVYL